MNAPDFNSLYVYKAICIRVIDGDTFVLDIDLGLNICARKRVRLHGVDTPETYGVKKDSEEYKAGKASEAYVKNVMFVEGEPRTLWVETHKDKTGKYGRYLATVWYQDEDKYISLNATLVSAGLAVEKTY
jgi:micrococcal nuclease